MLAVCKISNTFAPAAVTVLMIGMGISSPAYAVLRIEVQNPAGVCQGALPVYDTALRNRPAAISNEGSSNAFVSCSALGDNSSNSEPPTLFGARFVNNTGVNKTVNCTFVDGTRCWVLLFMPSSRLYRPTARVRSSGARAAITEATLIRRSTT